MSSLGLDNNTEYSEGPISDIPSYIVPSVISLLFCGIPGIVATVYAAKTISAKNRGDSIEAERCSGIAKLWMIIAFVLGTFGVIVRLATMR